MVYTSNFKGKILQDMYDRISTVEIGTGTTTPTTDDTDLATPTALTSKTADKSIVNDVLVVTYVRNNSDPGGNFTEIGVFDSDGELANRIIHGAINTTVTDNTRIYYSLRTFFE